MTEKVDPDPSHYSTFEEYSNAHQKVSQELDRLIKDTRKELDVTEKNETNISELTSQLESMRSRKK